MSGWLEGMREWLEALGPVGLFLWATAEAVFFPLPPDIPLVVQVVAAPFAAPLLVGLAAGGSAIGSLLAHRLGSLGEGWLRGRLAGKRSFEAVNRALRRHGEEMILLAAFTPLPYKLFCLAAGMLGLSRRKLFIYSLVGRTARFALVAAVALRAREAEVDLGNPVVWGSMVVVTLLLVGWAIWKERRRRQGEYPAMESTLLIIKPDATAAGHTGAILAMAEAEGLRIAGLKMSTLDPETAREHYAEHRERPFFADLVAFICGGPVVLVRLEREGAVAALRALAGATDPASAAP
ncbi:VTT domain-containing protein, partial [bacterium]|nr:VTT domain-containing protein [bacterium]